MPETRGDDGYATIWALSWLAACLVLGSIALAAAAIVAQQHSTDGAADLAAVAAATAVQQGADGCVQASITAAANGAHVVSCALDGLDVQVTVAVDLEAPIPLTLHSVARAGPR